MRIRAFICDADVDNRALKPVHYRIETLPLPSRTTPAMVFSAEPRHGFSHSNDP